MQRRREAAAGQTSVDRLDPERQTGPRPGGKAGALNGADLGAQGVEAGR